MQADALGSRPSCCFPTAPDPATKACTTGGVWGGTSCPGPASGSGSGGWGTARRKGRLSLVARLAQTGARAEHRVPGAGEPRLWVGMVAAHLEGLLLWGPSRLPQVLLQPLELCVLQLHAGAELEHLPKQAQHGSLTAVLVPPQGRHLGLQVGHPGQGEEQAESGHACRGWVAWRSRPSSAQAHHCSSCVQCLGESRSGMEVADARWLDSYLSEISSRLKSSGLASPSSSGSPRSPRVMVLVWVGGEAPDEGLLAASSAKMWLLG